MESFLLDSLREKCRTDGRQDGYCVYACFFRVGREKKTEIKLSLERTPPDMLVEHPSQRMQKWMH